MSQLLIPPVIGPLILLILMVVVDPSYQAQPQLDNDNLTPGEDCFRDCGTAHDYRVCHFNFEVHLYQTLSRACYNCPHNASDCDRPHCVPGDGFKRLITVANRQMPGPLIQVCVGDRIVVDVQNSLPSGDLTIHWHGLTMRAYNGSLGTPHMDGVPGLTQCPLLPGQLFRYDLVATEPGTHWWHAHTGFQRADGVYGGLIVREPIDPHLNLYDYDLPQHLILFHDWLHSTTESKYILRHYGGDDDFPESMLINGRGPHQSLDASELSQQIPYQRFKVKKGKRYRYRLVNAAVLNCPITFSIDEHSFTVITSDGNPIEPVEASSLVIYPGERWDIIISSNATIGTYWMIFMGGVDCAESSAHQFALLQYTEMQQAEDELEHLVLPPIKSKPQFTREIPSGVQINSINAACYNDKICAASLRSLTPLPNDLTSEKADHTLYLAFEMMRVNNKHFYSKDFYSFNQMHEDQQIPTPQINNISLKLPVSPLLTSRSEMPHCNVDSPPDESMCQNNHCECLHMYQLPIGATVDLVLIDEGQFGDENHVIHMHGYYFWVLAQDRPQDIEDAFITRDTVMDMDKKGLIKRNLVNPVLKDSVTIPDGGYTVVRLKTFNPGYWLLHCHLLFHSVGGMSLVLQVGDHSDLPPPPLAFPTCSDPHSGLCQVPYFKVNGKSGPECFRVHSENKIWSDARAVCQKEGGDLAQPKDLQALWNYLDKSNLLGDYWLGGSDLNYEGDWRWLSGDYITEHWYISQPQGDGNCLDFIAGNEPSLNDYKCDNTEPFICQII